MAHPHDALTISHVSKSFGSSKAVTGIDLTVEAGELYACIGPNGAGKTTLLKMIVGLLCPDRGTIKVFGNDVVSEPLAARRMISYIPDDPTPYDYLTGEEFVMLTANLRGVSARDAAHTCSRMGEMFRMSDIMRSPISQYSRGSRQKTAYIAAMVGNPRILIIDEPIVGLDPTSIEAFGADLSAYVKNGGTVFLATHILSFAAEHATRVGVINKGKLCTEQRVSAKTNLERVYQLAVSKS